MSWGYQFKIRIGVVLFKDGQLLMARQNNNPFWVLPGGTLELGEGIEETAIRELKEEADLDIEVICPLYLGDFIKQDNARNQAIHQEPEKTEAIKQTLDIVFLGQYLNGTLKMTQDENLNELAFFDYETFQTLSVMPDALFQALLKDWQQLELVVRQDYTNRQLASGYTDDSIQLSSVTPLVSQQNPSLQTCSNFPVYLGKYR